MRVGDGSGDPVNRVLQRLSMLLREQASKTSAKRKFDSGYDSAHLGYSKELFLPILQKLNMPLSEDAHNILADRNVDSGCDDAHHSDSGDPLTPILQRLGMALREEAHNTPTNQKVAMGYGSTRHSDVLHDDYYLTSRSQPRAHPPPAFDGSGDSLGQILQSLNVTPREEALKALINR